MHALPSSAPPASGSSAAECGCGAQQLGPVQSVQGQIIQEQVGQEPPTHEPGHEQAEHGGLIERPASWVALAGFMGTGKSRVGWELSRALALHFVDTDKLITRVVGKSIPEVFAHEGEGYFRACEGEVVRRVSRLDYAVVSLGGGTFINEDNRRTLLERGPVVVLWATPETILARTRGSDRPLLGAPDPLARIEALMSEREGAYRQGTIHVSSDGRPSEEIVEEIIERLWLYEEQRQHEEQRLQGEGGSGGVPDSLLVQAPLLVQTAPLEGERAGD